MIKALFLAIFIFCAAAPSFALEWRELKGDHFIVYFANNEDFAKEVLNKSEAYYQRITSDIGYARYSDYWTWGGRTKVYIYPDHPEYIKETRQPEWSQGLAELKGRESRKIISYESSEWLVKEILPHEIAHLIFRDFVGFRRGDAPLWLDEGVAQWEEGEGSRDKINDLMMVFLKDDLIFPVGDLTVFDVRKLSGIDTVFIRCMRTRYGEDSIGFLSTNALISAFYVQSASLVGFMIKRFGSDRFAVFCRELNCGKTLGDALKSAYPYFMENIADLEHRWLEYMRKMDEASVNKA